MDYTNKINRVHYSKAAYANTPSHRPKQRLQRPTDAFSPLVVDMIGRKPIPTKALVSDSGKRNVRFGS